MAYAKYYWRNPEKHLKESNERTRRLTRLGLTRREQLSPAAQIKKLTYERHYRRTHLKENAAASRKYRAKIIRAVGSCGEFSKWLYHVRQKNANRRNT